jgi:hypothetical protein
MLHRARSGLAFAIAACGMSACAAGNPRATPPGAPLAPPVSSAGTASRPLPPLTAHETELQASLARDVALLAGKIGERSSHELWAHASAADALVKELESAGVSVQREGYSLEDGSPVQNLEAQISGGSRGNESVVVTAHYDSAIGSPGADDDASGVAGVLALARACAREHPARTIRLVLFATELPPYWKTAQLGARVYAKQSAGRGDRIVAVLALDSIGYYSTQPGSQQRPGALAFHFSDTGDFLALVGNPSSGELAERLAASLRSASSLPAVGVGLPEDVAELGSAAAAEFWAMGIPAVTVTDTGALRDPQHGKAGDTPDHLDMARMARAVAGLERVVLELASVQ